MRHAVSFACTLGLFTLSVIVPTLAWAEESVCQQKESRYTVSANYQTWEIAVNEVPPHCQGTPGDPFSFMVTVPSEDRDPSTFEALYRQQIADQNDRKRMAWQLSE